MIAANLFVTPRSWPVAKGPVTTSPQPVSLATPAECVRRVGQHFPEIWPRLDRLRVKYADGAHCFPDHWYLPFNGIVAVLDELLEAMAQAGAQVGAEPGRHVRPDYPSRYGTPPHAKAGGARVGIRIRW